MRKRIIAAALLLSGPAFADPVPVGASRLLTQADCNTRIYEPAVAVGSVAAPTADVILTEPSSPVLTTPCRISFTNLNTTYKLQIAPAASGDALHWWDYSTGTIGVGNPIIAGVAAGGVLTQENTTDSTFGWGE